MTEYEKKKERFIRWQGITIAQLSYSMHLILALSVAALGFGVSLLLNSDFKPTSCWKFAYCVSLFFLFISIGHGIVATLTRLIDFRKTTRITKLKCEVVDSDEIAYLKGLTKELGKWTWRIFYCQIVTFGIGIVLFIIAIAFPVVAKLMA